MIKDGTCSIQFLSRLLIVFYVLAKTQGWIKNLFYSKSWEIINKFVGKCYVHVRIYGLSLLLYTLYDIQIFYFSG